MREPDARPGGGLALKVAVGAASSSAAGLVTNPIDVIKTEMQLAGKARLGLLGTVESRIARLGLSSLWAGVSAMVMRSFFFAGLRLGTYDDIKDALGAREHPLSMWRKIAAGTLSGALGATAGNPVEVVKTRLQAEPGRYRTVFHALSSLARTEGLRGLGQGLGPHIVRGAALTASQVGVYDGVKQRLARDGGLEEGVVLRFAAAMVSGLVTATVTSPFDVLKTRLMTSGGSIVGTARAVLAEGGPLGFFRGWVPQYARLGPHTVITFLVYEQLRTVVGLGAV